jgi:hypothetical protein
MTSSFTIYAQNFMNHVNLQPNSSQAMNQNINLYVNNPSVNIQNKETININNNYLVINQFVDNNNGKIPVPVQINQINDSNISKVILKNNPFVMNSELNNQNEKEYMIEDVNINPNIEGKFQRRDRRGVPIMKGSKKHKISFSDSSGSKSNFVDVIRIESYKNVNALNTYNESNVSKSSDSVSCCSIF